VYPHSIGWRTKCAHGFSQPLDRSICDQVMTTIQSNTITDMTTKINQQEQYSLNNIPYDTTQYTTTPVMIERHTNHRSTTHPLSPYVQLFVFQQLHSHIIQRSIDNNNQSS